MLNLIGWKSIDRKKKDYEALLISHLQEYFYFKNTSNIMVINNN